MPRQIPTYVSRANIGGAPVDFKWGKTVAAKIFGHEVDERLYEAVRKSSFKATYAVGIAATEWVVLRLAGHTDTTDALNRIEAAWASTLELSLCQDLRFRLSPKSDDPQNVINGPLEIGLALLYSMHSRYSRSNLNLPEAACRQMLLAQHIVPKAAKFDVWLSATLGKLASAFPTQVKQGEQSYDPSHEEVVPREFFEADFVYTKDSATAFLRAFLATLTPAENSYLRTP